jgi:hypothetical protein
MRALDGGRRTKPDLSAYAELAETSDDREVQGGGRVASANFSAGSVTSELLNTPVVGALAWLVVGCTPFLRDLCFGKGALLGIVHESVQTISVAMVPSMMLLLSANKLPPCSSSHTAARRRNEYPALALFEL